MLTFLSYTDPYVSLTEGVGSFFGNRSFVIHWANSTRLACANFEPAQEVLGEGWFGGRGHGGSRPSSRLDSSADDATATVSATASWSSAAGGSLPTNFGGGFGGWGKPTVTTKANFGVPAGGDIIAPSSGALSSIYSQYSEYWSESSWPTSGALSTFNPTTNVLAVSTKVDDLPALPTAVTASGFNFSTSVLSASSTGNAAPVVFEGSAASQGLPKILTSILVLMAVVILC